MPRALLFHTKALSYNLSRGTWKEILLQGDWCLGMGHRCNITQPLTSPSLPNLHVHLEAKVGRMCVNINKESPQLKSYLHFCPGL